MTISTTNIEGKPRATPKVPIYLLELFINKAVGYFILVTGQQIRRKIMLNWALGFLVIAIIAAVLGFGGIAGTAVEIAKIIFIVFLVLFLVAAVMSVIRGKSPPV